MGAERSQELSVNRVFPLELKGTIQQSSNVTEVEFLTDIDHIFCISFQDIGKSKP